MNAPADDKLHIYKTQANSISTKKAEKEAEAKSEVNNTETESDPQVRAAVKYL